MDLSPYVDAVRGDLEAAAAAGTPEAQAAAHRLGAALEASLRLCLLEALSDLAAEVTTSSDVTVELRLRGREPEVVITAVEPQGAPQPPAEPDAADDGGTARLTVRLPESLKARAEDDASRAGLSVNAWMVRAVHRALSPTEPTTHRDRRRTTGYARS